MAGRKDITIDQGSTFTLPLTITNGDGSPFVLTNWTATGQLRRTHRSPSVIATFTCTIISEDLGEMEITLSAENTAAISAGESVNDPRSQYVWDLELTNSSTGEVKRLLEGFAYISPDVTRT